jgi:hypothetical protein
LHINLNNKLVREKIKSRPGGKSLLLAAGFQCNELTQELVMDETDIDVDWINAVVVKGTEVLADNEGTQ